MVIQGKKTIDPEIEKLLAPEEGLEIPPETPGAEVKLQELPEEGPEARVPEVSTPPLENPIKKMVAADLLEELMKDDLLSVEDEYGILKLLEDVSAGELVVELNEIIEEFRLRSA